MFFADPDEDFCERIPTLCIISKFINIRQDNEIEDIFVFKIRVKNIDIAPQAEKVPSDHGKDPESLSSKREKSIKIDAAAGGHLTVSKHLSIKPESICNSPLHERHDFFCDIF